MFWALKRFFPGDSDFSRENFKEQPYEYVIAAYNRIWKMRQSELHEYELPIANLAALTANVNAGGKNKKQYTANDFSMFTPVESLNLPETAAAAAYMFLVKEKMLPSWALFCFKDMKTEATPPSFVAFICEDAILLAPQEEELGFKGLLIAQESASSETRTMTSPCGRTVELDIPHVKTKVIAESATLLTYPRAKKA